MSARATDSGPARRSVAVILVISLTLFLGNLTICDLLSGNISTGDTLRVSVDVGDVAVVEGGVNEVPVRFAICNPGPPQGVFSRMRTALGVFWSLDIVATAEAVPGVYTMEYRRTYYDESSEVAVFWDVEIGVLELTVEAASALRACFDLKNLPVVDQVTTFVAGCSTGDITEYRWWWDWQGGSSAPDYVGSSPVVNNTFLTPGFYIIRLEVVGTEGAASTDREIEVIE